uniref:Uncharacterized protein n=1 Tax=Siphoviridae sp. ctnMR5 TaxID=2825658 RepID=A0A8S5U8U1_9CAUD|nr:MAG TPA: hypothetical protein [Siphoviridae sp. ctnMR5]
MTIIYKYSIIKTVKRDEKLLTVTKKSNRPRYAKSKRLPFTTRYAKTENRKPKTDGNRLSCVLGLIVRRKTQKVKRF